MLMIKWAFLIVSIFLTTSGRLSDVKLNMVEAIENIVYHEKIYNWVAHIL